MSLFQVHVGEDIEDVLYRFSQILAALLSDFATARRQGTGGTVNE